MTAKKQTVRAGNLLGAILDLGRAMIVCGGEVWHVEEILGMMFDTYCFKEHEVLIMSNGMHATVQTWDGRVYTQVRRLGDRQYDLDKLERLFSLAHEVSAQPLGVNQLRDRIYEILESAGTPLWKGFIGSAVAAGGFCAFFSGDVFDVIAAAFTAVIIYSISKHSMRLLRNSLAANTFSAFAMEVIILLLTMAGAAHDPGPITSANILLLISGLGVTAGFKDLLHGDALSGIIDTTNAVLGAVGIAIGITMAMFVMPGGTSGTEVHSLVNGYALQTLFCTIGCAGFAVVFGAKGRTLIYSAIGAAATWTVFLIASNSPIDSTFAATLAGAAFVAFYSLALERFADIPAIVILTACAFPLIPGANLYYTVMGAILHDNEMFRSQGTTLLLVCIGISAGFIMVDVAKTYFNHFEEIASRRRRRK